MGRKRGEREDRPWEWCSGETPSVIECIYRLSILTAGREAISDFLDEGWELREGVACGISFRRGDFEPEKSEFV